jgi:hypothetical protein
MKTDLMCNQDAKVRNDMERSVTVVLVMFMAVFAGTEAAQASSPLHDTTMSSLVGTVIDKNDARIAGAVIRIENASYHKELQTDDTGVFHLELPAGTYCITVEKDGFRRFVIPSFRTDSRINSRITVRMKVRPPQNTLKIKDNIQP